MSLILGWLTSKIAGPIAAGLAVLFAVAFAWQTAQIDGWAVFGGGYKAQVAALTLQVKDNEKAWSDYRAQAAEIVAQANDRAKKAGDDAAAAHAAAQTANANLQAEINRKVTTYVSPKSDAACVMPWGAVRLLDAAASGSDPSAVAARVAPGVSNDSTSDVTLSEAITLLTDDLSIARDNADQLKQLQAAVSVPQ